MKTRRLLYVDDDQAIRLLVKRIFEKKFPAYEVLLAANGPEALAQLRQRKGTTEFPNAIVTDVRLGPSDDGTNLIEIIRAEFPKMRSVVVSAVTLREDLQRAIRAGADAFLEKSVSLHAFADRLLDLIQCPTDDLPVFECDN
jgi:CheY-like chemotaxis protein